MEETGYVIVIGLAENYVEVKKKLVANAESVMADLTSKAVEMINVFTSPHHHFQRRYGFHALRTNPCRTKQSAKNRNKKLGGRYFATSYCLNMKMPFE